MTYAEAGRMLYLACITSFCEIRGRKTSQSKPRIYKKSGSVCCEQTGETYFFFVVVTMNNGIARNRLMEERKQWRKDHPHVRLTHVPWNMS